MADLEIKNVATPDETRPFVDKGEAAVVDVAGHPVLYGTFEPGWRWSEHLKPIAGTDTCQATHLLYCLSGRMRVETSSGEQGEVGPGDVLVGVSEAVCAMLRSHAGATPVLLARNGVPAAAAVPPPRTCAVASARPDSATPARRCRRPCS